MIDANEARQLSGGYASYLNKIEALIRADARAHTPCYEIVTKVEDHMRSDIVVYLMSLGYTIQRAYGEHDEMIRISWRYTD